MRDRRAHLTGREKIIEILPLDFLEFLSFRGVSLKKRDQILLSTYFDEYLESGGMPEYVLRPDREYLKTLIDDIIYKDIIAFHNLKNHRVVSEYFILLMERAGKQVSINKMANILGISADTSKRYFEMFEETYLIHSIKRHGKTNERLLSPRKVYAPDTGIRNYVTGFRDKGSVFENYLYLKIKKEDPSYVYQDGTEIDFFLERIKWLIESKWGPEINKKQRALFETFPATERFIISSYEDVKNLTTRLSEPELSMQV